MHDLAFLERPEDPRLEVAECVPVAATTAANAIDAETIRAAGAADAVAIAALFADVYESSSHPCSDPGYVAAMLSSGTLSMVVCERAGALLGTAGVARLPVARSYSPCYLVTRRDCRGAGYSGAMYSRVVELMLARADCELVLQFPRTRLSYSVVRKGMGIPLLVFGHDASMNLAFGVRETHIVAVSFNPSVRILRAIPPHPVDAVERRMRRIASVLPVEATPRAFGVASIGAGLTLGVDPSCLQLVVPDHVHDTAGALDAIDAQVLRWRGVEHLFTFVPVAHGDLVLGLVERGFRATGYVPAWLPEDGVRHDCVLMTRFAGKAAHDYGLSRFVSGWDRALAGFGGAA